MHKITLLPDGTRIDVGEGSYDFPLSLDLKITDYCERGCPWCHESSGIEGKHGNVDLILEKLSGLPETTEIALGGGNPLSHPDLKRLVSGLGCIVNMTVRDKDRGEIPEGITGLGVSVSPNAREEDLGVWSSIPNTVAHLILGINSLEDYELAKKMFSRVLWLGFKIWGRNKNSTLPDLTETRRKIVQDLYSGRDITLAFDNLAISQLSLKSCFLKSEWEKFYLGPEFTCSMYVDGVKGEYAGYSTSPNRVSWDDISLIDYFRGHDKNIT